MTRREHHRIAHVPSRTWPRSGVIALRDMAAVDHDRLRRCCNSRQNRQTRPSNLRTCTGSRMVEEAAQRGDATLAQPGRIPKGPGPHRSRRHSSSRHQHLGIIDIGAASRPRHRAEAALFPRAPLLRQRSRALRRPRRDGRPHTLNRCWRPRPIGGCRDYLIIWPALIQHG